MTHRAEQTYKREASQKSNRKEAPDAGRAELSPINVKVDRLLSMNLKAPLSAEPSADDESQAIRASSVIEDRGTNLICEGDNYIWLNALNKHLNGQIDVIYIDPPYNTGNSNFRYKDRYGGGKHGSRSRRNTGRNDDIDRERGWDAFMRKRLEAACNLMSRKGIIFISIGDDEQANLRALCDGVFGRQCYYGTFIQLKGNTQNDSKRIQSNHEYILAYSKSAVPSLLKERAEKKAPVRHGLKSYSGIEHDINEWTLACHAPISDDNRNKDKSESEISEQQEPCTMWYEIGAFNGRTGNSNTLSERLSCGYTVYYLDSDKLYEKDIKATLEAVRAFERRYSCLSGSGKSVAIEAENEELDFIMRPYVLENSEGHTRIVHAIVVRDYDMQSARNIDASEDDVYSDVEDLIDYGYVKIRPPRRRLGRLGGWTWSAETLASRWNAGEVLIEPLRNGSASIARKTPVDDDSIIVTDSGCYAMKSSLVAPKSIIGITNRIGTSELSGENGVLPGCMFNNPKSVELIKHLISLYSHVSRDATVLDFFAGSGTTAQAVMELNEEDGGSRRWILITNNDDGAGGISDETGICRTITKPRVDTVITGTRPDGSRYSDGISKTTSYAYMRCSKKQPANDSMHSSQNPCRADDGGAEHEA